MLFKALLVGIFLFSFTPTKTYSNPVKESFCVQSIEKARAILLDLYNETPSFTYTGEGATHLIEMLESPTGTTTRLAISPSGYVCTIRFTGALSGSQ